jgi:3-phosphoglycerate kinase
VTLLLQLKNLKLQKIFSYISTAGGAFLEFAEGKKLPAIEILERRFLNARKSINSDIN